MERLALGLVIFLGASARGICAGGRAPAVGFVLETDGVPAVSC